MSRAVFAPLLLAGILCAGAAAAQPGSSSDPIVVHMRRGTDHVRLTGRLVQNGPECCYYQFKAHAGQTLTWSVTGPTVRAVLTDPNGNADGPGLASSVPLPADGNYVLAITPDLMADGAFGRFVLKLRIPPAGR